MDNNITEIKQLIESLNRASKAYYQEDREIISNLEYDQMYDQLVALEKESGVVLSNSPTRKVGYELLSSLPKERHISPMLSLDKTKEIEMLVAFLKDQKGLLSWKLDGLTIVLTYRDGALFKAVTRGNGDVGEVITNNARVFQNIPAVIPYKEELIIRGEAVIKYSDFEKINEDLPAEKQYKNPRNLCSGTVRQLNNEITARRNVNFFAFQIVQAEAVTSIDSKYEQLMWLQGLGFEFVETVKVTASTLEKSVNEFKANIVSRDVASDGLVLTYDSITYSNSLGTTSKFPKHSLAFKWMDEEKSTRLIEVEWSASRTGLINPVAIFEPVELEGTTVSRASLHNISILEELELGQQDEVLVYKANMIIPQIADNLTRSHNILIPTSCPVCNEPTMIKQDNGVKALYCTNPQCQAKQIKQFTHFVSRDAMNIENLSEATIEKFINKGFIKSLPDIFTIEKDKEAIITMDGFGEKSYERLIKSIKKSSQVNLHNFIYGLGILNVGLANAKLLCKSYHYDLEQIMTATEADLMAIEGFGEVIAKAVVDYFKDETHIEMVNALKQFITFNEIATNHLIQKLDGLTFVITGSLEKYENRNALKDKIESLGGKVTGSVTKKTNYLINNDLLSTSSKNKKANELGISIINEETFETIISEDA
jgi:DNA ligase (NAD+)